MITLLFSLLEFTLGMGVGFMFKNRRSKQEIIEYNWIDVNDFAPPKEGNIYVTDGDLVKPSLVRMHNNEGKLVFSLYNGNIVTHWLPIPLPPKK